MPWKSFAVSMPPLTSETRYEFLQVQPSRTSDFVLLKAVPSMDRYKAVDA